MFRMLLSCVLAADLHLRVPCAMYHLHMCHVSCAMCHVSCVMCHALICSFRILVYQALIPGVSPKTLIPGVSPQALIPGVSPQAAL